MSLDVVWEPAAVSLATRFLADDPDGLRSLVEAIDALAGEPRPRAASELGSSGLYRLRVGRYRAVYEVVAEDTPAVRIRHIGRRAGSSRANPPPRPASPRRELEGSRPDKLGAPA